MLKGKWMEWLKSGAFLSLLFVLFILCLGARITGILEHELLGIVLCLCLLLHSLRHGVWFTGLLEGRWGLRRALSTLTNGLMALGFVFLLVTGVALSPDLFAFLEINSGMTTRQLHSGIAFWLMVLIAIHLGLHGPMIARKIENQLTKTALLPLAGLTLLIGAFGFIDRMLFEKLFLGFAFDFWDPERPVLLYFIFYAAACAAIGIIVHLVIEALKRKNGLLKTLH